MPKELAALYEGLHHVSPDEAREAARRYGESSDGPVRAVSACLLGLRCRYDGQVLDGVDLDRLLRGLTPLPLCPEVLAGFGVPRPPMDFRGGDGAAALDGQARLVDVGGRDCTARLAFGSALALDLAQAAGCDSAVLKARSPSCGVHRVHTEAGLVPGRGMFATLCARAGLAVQSDEDAGIHR